MIQIGEYKEEMKSDNKWLVSALGGEDKLDNTEYLLAEVERQSLIWFEKIAAILDENKGKLDYPLFIRLNALLDSFGKLNSVSSLLKEEFRFILGKKPEPKQIITNPDQQQNPLQF